jgi:hypothetical protein
MAHRIQGTNEAREDSISVLNNKMLNVLFYRRLATNELVDVEINAIWSTNLEQFDFDTDMSTTALSRAIAREPWSREYFQTLKEYQSNLKIKCYSLKI